MRLFTVNLQQTSNKPPTQRGVIVGAFLQLTTQRLHVLSLILTGTAGFLNLQLSPLPIRRRYETIQRLKLNPLRLMSLLVSLRKKTARVSRTILATSLVGGRRQRTPVRLVVSRDSGRDAVGL